MKYYALVGVFFIVAYLLPLAGRPMVTPDELVGRCHPERRYRP